MEQNDPEIAKAIHDELVRQQDQIEMIASENIVSSAVLEAQGSVLTNKYAEIIPAADGAVNMSMWSKHGHRAGKKAV